MRPVAQSARAERARATSPTRAQVAGASRPQYTTSPRRGSTARDVNLRVERGTIHALIGPNGAGKAGLCAQDPRVERQAHGRKTVR
jgi:ABC-type polysaccharide/polyol phosphate transport system ATPase subunit